MRMAQVVDIANVTVFMLYLILFGGYLYDFLRGEKFTKNLTRVLLFVSLLVHFFYLIIRTIAFDHPPITNVFEIFTVLAFAICFSYFILELLTDIRGTGVFIIFIAVVFQTISTIFIEDLVEVRDVLRSNLLGTHVFSALLGYSGITISAVYGFLYLTLYKDLKVNKYGLLFDRLPNLELLEKLSFYSAIIGFVLLTIAMTIGIIWLPQAFPNFSFFDPKLIATSLVWLMYGIGITLKFSGKWYGKKVVITSIIGFVLAISSTIVTNFISKSFHSFY